MQLAKSATKLPEEAHMTDGCQWEAVPKRRVDAEVTVFSPRQPDAVSFVPEPH